MLSEVLLVAGAGMLSAALRSFRHPALFRAGTFGFVLTSFLAGWLVGGSAWTGLLTDTDVFWRYTCNLLLPLDLSFFYGVEPVLSLADPRVLLCGGGLAILWAGMIWLAGPRWRWLANVAATPGASSGNAGGRLTVKGGGDT